MSAFLGPVHHWLFNKIRLFEELEKNITIELTKEYGEEVKVISDSMEKQYGQFIPNQPLETLIDTNNIHGWLQNKIVIAETRQAATLKKFIDQFGNGVISIAESVFLQQGTDCGKAVNDQSNSLSAIDIYKQLNDYLLDGMPCDHVNNLTVAEPTHLKWNTVRCLHQPYWLEAGVDVNTMYQLRFAWIKSFIEAANPTFTYHVEGKGGNDGFVHSIVTK
ncbi:hypothetical protein [Alkaliphilus transvaalensis]|uniref:hypothetical protein n=1 Tax=Alkaliphilus transvaalensis TaxID=114628 RepID=UPI0004795189|nr:hypothetical protein [Alkaliphilus transvaalensis]